MNVPLNIDFQQVLLHLLNFVILFAIMYFLLYKPVKAFMEKRIAYYKRLDEDAELKLAEAEKTRAECDSRFEALKEELEAERVGFTAAIKKEKDERLEKARAEAAGILEESRQNAELERKRIISGAKEEITEMAALAAAKLVFKNTPEAYDEFLDSVERGGKHE